MKMRMMAMSVLTALALSVIAGPALAASDVGVFTGVADVAKEAQCGLGGLNADGIGLPVITGIKKAKWGLSTLGSGIGGTDAVVVSANGGLGDLNVCGDLYPALSFLTGGIGAACGMSKGDNGSGNVDFFSTPGIDVNLNNVGWKFTAGGTLPVIGEATFPSGKPDGTLVAVVQAQGGDRCVSKTPNPQVKNPNKDGGATRFNVVGVYAVVQGVDLDWNDVPGFCKSNDPACALAGPKKQG